MLRHFANKLRLMNLRRRTASRLERLRFMDVSEKRTEPVPELCRRVILMTSSVGWGDSLFVGGLAARLKENGIETAVAVPEDIVERYSGNRIYENVFILGKDDLRATAYGAEAIVSLDWLGMRCAEERMRLVRVLGVPAVTASTLEGELNLFSTRVDFRKALHVSERIALLLATITHRPETPVMPYAQVTETDMKRAESLISEVFPRKPEKLVYLNATARDADRCLSPEQTCRLSLELVEAGFDGVLVHSSKKGAVLLADAAVRELPEVSFGTLTAIVKRTKLVVTPDTSVTHIASAMNVPSFVIFPPNDRDYMQENAAADVWGGMSVKTFTYREDDPELAVDSTGFANRAPGTNQSYSREALAAALQRFITEAQL